jgi:dTDP-4-amino-4,6-dideoxygalactose transaminase
MAAGPHAHPVIEEEAAGETGRGIHCCGPADGQVVETLEKEFAEYLGTRYAVAVGSGGAALFFALLAHGVGRGDEVITSPLAGTAVLRAILGTGATPVPAGIDSQTYTLEPNSVEAAITKHTRAIIPVHQFGCPCDMWALMALARRHGLWVVEDARRAHGAAWGGRKVGGFGEGCFSFTDGDMMAAGEGGMVTTEDIAVADAVYALRDNDAYECYPDIVVPCGSRMSAVSAALVRSQLGRLDGLVAVHVENAHRLSRGLADIATLVPPVEPDRGVHAFHRCAVRVLPEHPVPLENICCVLRKMGVEAAHNADTPLARGPMDRFAITRPHSAHGVGQPAVITPDRAGQLTNRLLFLPVHAGVGTEDIDRILMLMHLLAFRIPQDADIADIMTAEDPES